MRHRSREANDLVEPSSPQRRCTNQRGRPVGTTFIREARDLVDKLYNQKGFVAVTPRIGTAMAIINILFEHGVAYQMECTGFTYEFHLRLSILNDASR